MLKKVVPLLFILFSLISCTDKQTKKEIKNRKNANLINEYIKSIEEKKDKAVKEFIQQLSPEQKLSQIFIENLEGCTDFRSYEAFGDITDTYNNTPLVAGGYLFFSYNIAPTREQQKNFMTSISEYCEKNNVIPPFLAVDQEGGYVNRLRKLNTKLPAQEAVALTYDINEAYELYSSQARQMEELGFHMNFAPVMEVCTEDNKLFLDGRSFGDLQTTIDYGYACINGYENNQIGTIIKHFPGNTNTDPHTGLPEITLSKEELEESIKSFLEVLAIEPTGILMSHARTSALDSNTPACLSQVWITDILRNKYNYKGIIFSDDIFMGALANNGYPPELAVIMAVDAGIDCIMISEKRFAKPARMLYKKMNEDFDFAKKIDAAVERIIKYKLSISLLHFEEDEAGNYKVAL